MTRTKIALFDGASDEDARESRANLTEFFAILLEWDGAKASSAQNIDEEPQFVLTTRGRKPEP